MPKKIVLISLIFHFSISLCLWAQTDTSTELDELEKNYKIHTQEQIIEIMNKSSIHYEVKKVKEGEKPYSSFSISGFKPVEPNPFVRLTQKNGGEFTVYNDEPQGEMKNLIDGGMRELEAKNPLKAREYFEKATALDAQNFKAWSYLAQTYLAEADYPKAINYLKKAIALNEIAFQEYLLLAFGYLGVSDIINALDAATSAFMYDKNDPLILESLKSILDLNNLKLREPRFSFPFFLEAKNDKECTVFIIGDPGEYWLPSAFLSAIWLMEPEFKKIDAMFTDANRINILKIREMLLLQTFSFDAFLADNKILDEQQKYLHNAMGAGYMEEILTWEIAASTLPQAVYFLSKDERQKLKNYISTYVYIKK
jgi:tetratricopeptide (TPR) repeat protein